MTIQLRPHQIEAANAVEDAFRAGINRPLVDACVGSGKSLIMAEVARRAVARGERVIIGAHTRELVEQNAIACRSLGLTCGINAAALGERTWRAPVISAAIQSVYKSAASFGPISMFLGDECFPAGTNIDTPLGNLPIEMLYVGDMVTHALGVGRVEAVSRNLVTELVKVKFDDGNEICCTPSHLLFTLQGWTSASMAAGQVVFRYQSVRALRRGLRTPEEIQQYTVGEAAILLDILLKEARERDARSSGTRENDEYITLDWTSTESARGQWTSDDKGAGVLDRTSRTGMGGRISGGDAASTAMANALQDRRCESTVENSDRSGRRFASGSEGSGPKKRRASTFARVVSVSHIKLASPCAVYNLQVGGHPSYFANGILAHNCHLWPHSESGMYRSLIRDLRVERAAGFSGTVFRLQGGSLVEGEAAPFDKVIYRYSILDGIRDGYLVPAFSAPALDQVDVSKLRTRQGEFTGASSDTQMLDLMDSHIMQMVQHGERRRAWLCFEASTKAAKAMCARLNEWQVPTGLVLGETPAGERAATIAAYRAGRLRCMVNVAALTTGFDVQEVDMLVMRRPTKSLGLYIQMTGRLLRTIGGNIESSTAAGKADGIVLDFANVIATHGPLDFIRPKDSAARLASCDACGKRNAAAAARCWNCDEPMTKLCPACVEPVEKGTLDCPHCGHDMRTGGDGGRAAAKLLDTPSGAALISAYRPVPERQGGWLPVRKVWEASGTYTVLTGDGETLDLPEALAALAKEARWIRRDGTLLVPNGANRTSVRQYSADGAMLIVPMPQASEAQR